MSPRSTGIDFVKAIQRDLAAVSGAQRLIDSSQLLRNRWIEELSTAASVQSAMQTGAAEEVATMVAALNQAGLRYTNEMALYRGVAEAQQQTLRSWTSHVNDAVGQMPAIARFAAEVAAIDWWQSVQALDFRADRRLRSMNWWAFPSWTTRELSHFDGAGREGKRYLERALWRTLPVEPSRQPPANG